MFLIGAACAAVGGLVAWFLVPNRERDLESEDVRFREYLEANGWTCDFGDTLRSELKSTTYKI